MVVADDGQQFLRDLSLWNGGWREEHLQDVPRNIDREVDHTIGRVLLRIVDGRQRKSHGYASYGHAHKVICQH